jgi:hypothetical protein
MTLYFMNSKVYNFTFQRPFRGSDVSDIARSALNDEPHIPLSVSFTAADLIRRVCTCAVHFEWKGSRFDTDRFLHFQERVIQRLFLAFFNYHQALQQN